MFHENYLTSDFHFKPVYLLVKMASKTVMRPIYMSVLMLAMRFQSSRRNFPSILNLFFFCQLMRLFRKDFQRNVLHSIQMPSFTKEFERMFNSFSEIIVMRDMD